MENEGFVAPGLTKAQLTSLAFTCSACGDTAGASRAPSGVAVEVPRPAQAEAEVVEQPAAPTRTSARAAGRRADHAPVVVAEEVPRPVFVTQVAADAVEKPAKRHRRANAAGQRADHVPVVVAVEVPRPENVAQAAAVVEKPAKRHRRANAERK